MDMYRLFVDCIPYISRGVCPLPPTEAEPTPPPLQRPLFQMETPPAWCRPRSSSDADPPTPVMWPVMHAGEPTYLWTEWQTRVKTLPSPHISHAVGIKRKIFTTASNSACCEWTLRLLHTVIFCVCLLQITAHTLPYWSNWTLSANHLVVRVNYPQQTICHRIYEQGSV